MRENIGLFKAKRVDNKKWVEGYYVKCRSRHYLLEQYNNNGYDERWELSEWTEINPETLCECTGFADKNNKLVFENYKLRCAVEDPCTGKIYKYFNCIVKYCKTTNAWGWYGIDGRKVLNKIPPQQDYIEVIGNKFDSEVECD